MANKTTIACTDEQYENIIHTLFTGIEGIGGRYEFEPKPITATALEVEANTGLRIGDVLSLKRGSIILDNGRYRFNITEQKTGKKRTFTVPDRVYQFIEDYCDAYGIEQGQMIFPLTVRAVQKHIKYVAEYLGYEHISTHSFRKRFASQAYNNSGHDIELVRRLLQHSSASVTSRYIGISDARIDSVLNDCVSII